MFEILAPYHLPIKAIREQTLPLLLLYLLITNQMSEICVITFDERMWKKTKRYSSTDVTAEFNNVTANKMSLTTLLCYIVRELTC